MISKEVPTSVPEIKKQLIKIASDNDSCALSLESSQSEREVIKVPENGLIQPLFFKTLSDMHSVLKNNQTANSLVKEQINITEEDHENKKKKYQSNLVGQRSHKNSELRIKANRSCSLSAYHTSTVDNLDLQVKRGWLSKKESGLFSIWKKRFVILSDNKIKVFFN